MNEILLNDVLVYAQRVETYSNETKKKRKKQKLQKKRYNNGKSVCFV